MENTSAAFALVTFDERQSKIVEMRFFSGLSLEESEAIKALQSG